MKNSLMRYAKHAFGFFALIFVLLSVLSSTFIDTAVAQENTPPHAKGLKTDHPLISAAIDVQNSHTKRLMTIPGVVGTGIGLGPDGQPVIKIYTVRAGIPDIPAKLDSIPVRVEVTGMFLALTDPTARQSRPVPIGVSTGHPEITAGTIGVRVTDGTYVYALSNNHVYANLNEAIIGDSIIQPGTYDSGSSPADDIGTLYDFVPLDFSKKGKNYVDAAIAITTTSLLGVSTPVGAAYGTPSSNTVGASLNQAVQKYGRTTGWTHGNVTELNVTVNVCYKARGLFSCNRNFVAKFVDQISISPGAFSAGGDSGSLIVTDNSVKNPVGLLFAGSSTRTLANPIDLVLSQLLVVSGLSLTIDDGSLPTPVTDLAVTVTAPATVILGDFVPVDVTVENVGNQDVTSDITITLTDDTTGVVIGTPWIITDPGAGFSTTLTYSWEVSGALGAHTLTAVHNFSDAGDTNNSDSTTVTVTEEEAVIPSDIVLTATIKEKGRRRVQLAWNGATSENVDIFRDGELIATTTNDGAYNDNNDLVVNKTYTYQICEAGSISTCSNNASATFL